MCARLTVGYVPCPPCRLSRGERARHERHTAQIYRHTRTKLVVRLYLFLELARRADDHRKDLIHCLKCAKCFDEACSPCWWRILRSNIRDVHSNLIKLDDHKGDIPRLQDVFQAARHRNPRFDVRYDGDLGVGEPPRLWDLHDLEGFGGVFRQKIVSRSNMRSDEQTQVPTKEPFLEKKPEWGAVQHAYAEGRAPFSCTRNARAGAWEIPEVEIRRGWVRRRQYCGRACQWDQKDRKLCGQAWVDGAVANPSSLLTNTCGPSVRVYDIGGTSQNIRVFRRQ